MQLALFDPPAPSVTITPPVAVDSFRAHMQYRRKGRDGTWHASTTEARGQGSREALERCRANAGHMANEWEPVSFVVVGPSVNTGEIIPWCTWHEREGKHNPRPEWLRPEER